MATRSFVETRAIDSSLLSSFSSSVLADGMLKEYCVGSTVADGLSRAGCRSALMLDMKISFPEGRWVSLGGGMGTLGGTSGA